MNDKTNTGNRSEFVNSAGEPWHEVAGKVFRYMCPDTGRACHSLCVCYSNANRECTKYGVYF